MSNPSLLAKSSYSMIPALQHNTSSPFSATAFATMVAVLLVLVKSSRSHSTNIGGGAPASDASCWMAQRACSATSDGRLSKITSAPFRAHANAVAYPKPLVAPVIAIFLPIRDGSCSTYDGYNSLGRSLVLNMEPEYAEPEQISGAMMTLTRKQWYIIDLILVAEAAPTCRMCVIDMDRKW